MGPRALACLLMISVIGPLFLPGQPASNKKPDAAKGLSPEVEGVLDASWAAPAEFTADVLITLVNGGFVPDRDQQKALLQRAYDLALGAPEKINLDADASGPIITAWRQLNERGGAALDQVSIRSNAVASLLRIDPGAGLDLFERIHLPLDQKFTCDEAIAPRFQTYYQALSAALKVADRERRHDLLITQLGYFRSPAQIGPFADVLTGVLADSPAGLDDVIYGFAGRLPALEMDDRVFTFYFGTFGSGFRSLNRLALQLSPGMRQHLLEQVRAWLVASARHGVCTQRTRKVMSIDGKWSDWAPVHPVEAFNKQLAPLLPGKLRIELSGLDLPPPGPDFKTVDYSTDYTVFWQMRKVLAGDDPGSKNTARWRSVVDQLVATIVDWKASDVDDSDPTAFYLEKAGVLRDFLALVKAPAPSKVVSSQEFQQYRAGSRADFPSRDRVASALVQHYESGVGLAVYRKRRILWFEPVREILGSRDNEAIRELLAQSGHPVLHLYGQLAKLEASAGRNYF